MQAVTLTAVLLPRARSRELQDLEFSSDLEFPSENSDLVTLLLDLSPELMHLGGSFLGNPKHFNSRGPQTL